MTVNQEEESLRESCPSRATDQDVGDKINGETKEIEKPRMIGKTKQSHTSVAPTLDVDSSLSKHDPPRRESRIGDVLAAGESESRMTNGKTEIGHVLGESNRFSSLEMRRLPVNILLKPVLMDSTSMVSDEFHTDDKDKEVVGEDKDFLHCLCLRPGYSLRTQLMLSFGSISIITIVLVVLICVVVAELVGQNVKNISKTAFEEITTETQILTARYLAETLTEKLLLVDAVKLLVEATRDRFSGYPSASESDVPFFDILSRQGKYPVDFPPPPLEWQFEANVNANNYEEHFQSRNYYKNRDASTASASFVFKGICDPSETDPLGDAFWPNCTDANNDVSTGGVVEPTNTTAVIYNKGKDLIPLLKSIFESRDVINDVGVYFANSGAGATLNYPHYTISTQSSYESTGCGWMTTPNFYDPTRPIGTPEMIERCSPRRTIVSSRMYSPMERGWCVSQALEPDRVHYEAGPDAWDNASWILVMGQAVYDRITQEFLACTYVGITLGVIDQELMQATVVEGEILSLIDHSRGGIIVGSSKPNRNASESVSIYDADFGMTKTEYDELLNLVDYDSQWDPVEVRRKYTDFQVRNGKYFLSTYPIPPVPDGFDRTYMPLFMVVVSTPLESIYGVVSEASDMIDDRVRAVNIFCVTAGAVGLLFALLVISMMAEMLTRPLRKMNQIASEIVNNFGDPTKENAIENSADGNVSGEARCTPKTELSEVVKEFNKLVASFSGSSMVKTEHHKHHEICNTFNLQKEFLTLYESRIQEKFMYSVEPPTRRNFHENAEEECMAYIHGGTNMMDDHDTFTTNPPIYHEAKAQRNFSSPLFLWIVALMVTPLLFVNVIITAVALNTVSNEFAGSVEQAEVFFLNVEKAKLAVQSRLRADFVAGFTAKATSDLFVLTRYAGWLLFGGLGPSNSYNRLMSGAEECKVYNDPLSCPFVEENIFCDCAWKDKITSAPCRSFPEGSRHLQKSFWACQSDDADEKGNRLTSTYPKTSYSPESTVWWGDQESVPGFDNATIGNTGYANLYERLRTAAALPLFEAMYNYPEIKDSTIGIYLAFESDGLFVGYNGCSSANHVAMSRFQSTVENGAARLRPELCPLGKFGFDPRYVIKGEAINEIRASLSHELLTQQMQEMV